MYVYKDLVVYNTKIGIIYFTYYVFITIPENVFSQFFLTITSHLGSLLLKLIYPVFLVRKLGSSFRSS